MAVLSVRHLSLEGLAYKAGTDKSKDDHKYVDVYAALFDPLRTSVRNITELGVAAGQSVELWHNYFPNAHVFGIDPDIRPRLRKDFSHMPRVHLLKADAYVSSLDALSLTAGSMDIVIDDAQHETAQMERALATFFPLVRPGGYYVIEDIEWDRETSSVRMLNTKLSAATERVLHENAAFFVDSLFGHRNFSEWRRRTGDRWTLDRERHNSHLAIIRKRADDVPPFEMHFGVRAMKPKG